MIELKLLEKLQQAGMTAYRLAQLTEIHETQIGKLKSGRMKGITFATLDKLCDALNCEPGDLLVRNNRKGKNPLSKNTVSEKQRAQRKSSRKRKN